MSRIKRPGWTLLSKYAVSLPTDKPPPRIISGMKLGSESLESRTGVPFSREELHKKAKDCIRQGIDSYRLCNRDVESLEAAMQRDDELEIYFHLGSVNDKLGNFSQAIRCFEYVYQSFPSSHEKIQRTLTEPGDIWRFQEDAREFQIELNRSLGDCYLMVDRLQGATNRYLQAIGLHGEDLSNAVDILDQLGYCYLQQGKYEEAISVYQTINTFGQMSRDYSIGYCYLKLGRYEEALEFIKKAYESISKYNKEMIVQRGFDSCVFVDLGLCYEGLGDHRKARRKFKRAVRRCDKRLKYDPNDSDAYSDRALSFERLGKAVLARKDYDMYERLKNQLVGLTCNRTQAYELIGRADLAGRDRILYEKQLRHEPNFFPYFERHQKGLVVEKSTDAAHCQ
jgi:tetratricopeptide (TPR) repeat protein